MPSTITITPVTPVIGAEISGIDLNQPLSQTDADKIYSALIEHQVIFFRHQNITPANHVAFAESFGKLDAPHPVYDHVDGYEQIVKLANDAGNPPDTDGWHTDLTFKANPPFASILVAREVPTAGGDTLWSSMYAAYNSLPAELKTLTASLRAVHDMGDFRNNFTVNKNDAEPLNTAMQKFGCALHDVVKTHPVSGQKYLYVNEGFTTHIIGKTSRESRRIINFLLDHISRPEYQVRFQWSPGDIAMWDNRCTQHYAVADYLPAYRCMNRITVTDDQRAG